MDRMDPSACDGPWKDMGGRKGIGSRGSGPACCVRNLVMSARTVLIG